MVWSLFPQNLVNYPTPGPGQFKRSIYDFYVSTENINFSRKDQLVTEEHPERWTTFQGIKTEFPAMQHFLLFTKISAGVLPVPIFWHIVGQHFPRNPWSLSMPHIFAVTRAELLFVHSPYDQPILFKTLTVIAAMLLILVDSAIAIGLLVGVTVLSVCVFCAIAYVVASSKTKEKDSKYRHPYPASSHGFSPGIYV